MSFDTLNVNSTLLSPIKKMRLSKVDPSSYSKPENEVIEHIDLDWNIDFERHVVSGTATYSFKIIAASIETIVSICLFIELIWSANLFNFCDLFCFV